jgi:hypothetical protein
MNRKSVMAMTPPPPLTTTTKQKKKKKNDALRLIFVTAIQV